MTKPCARLACAAHPERKLALQAAQYAVELSAIAFVSRRRVIDGSEADMTPADVAVLNEIASVRPDLQRA